MKPFRVEPLTGGREIAFYDHSNRYYGDYHRVRIVACMDVELTADLFAGQSDPAGALRRARRWLGDWVRFERSLERMGVAGNAVEAVREELVRRFLETGKSYLEHPLFGVRLVQKQLEARRKGPKILSSPT